MSYRVGDDGAAGIYPITDDSEPPVPIDFAAVVSARRWLGDTVTLNGEWLGSPASTRELTIPLETLGRGLWTLWLIVPDDTDLKIGKVVID